MSKLTAEQQAEKDRQAAEQARLDAEEAERKAAEAAEAARAEKYAGKTVTLKTIDVVITRNDTTEIADTIFEFELPVVRALFGPDFVRVTGEDSAEYEGFNAASELERLKRKYAQKDGNNPVDLIYRGDPRALAREAGVSYSGQSASKPKKSSQTPAKKKVIGRSSR